MGVYGGVIDSGRYKRALLWDQGRAPAGCYGGTGSASCVAQSVVCSVQALILKDGAKARAVIRTKQKRARKDGLSYESDGFRR